MGPSGVGKTKAPAKRGRDRVARQAEDAGAIAGGEHQRLAGPHGDLPEPHVEALRLQRGLDEIVVAELADGPLAGRVARVVPRHLDDALQDDVEGLALAALLDDVGPRLVLDDLHRRHDVADDHLRQRREEPETAEHLPGPPLLEVRVRRSQRVAAGEEALEVPADHLEQLERPVGVRVRDDGRGPRLVREQRQLAEERVRADLRQDLVGLVVADVEEHERAARADDEELVAEVALADDVAPALDRLLDISATPSSSSLSSMRYTVDLLISLSKQSRSMLTESASLDWRNTLSTCSRCLVFLTTPMI